MKDRGVRRRARSGDGDAVQRGVEAAHAGGRVRGVGQWPAAADPAVASAPEAAGRADGRAGGFGHVEFKELNAEPLQPAVRAGRTETRDLPSKVRSASRGPGEMRRAEITRAPAGL